jgi:NADH dehydrogenase
VILVAGGTGRLGALVVHHLAEQGRSVRVLTRDPARAAALFGDRVDVCAGDVRDPVSLEAAMAGARVVLSAVHGFTGNRGESPESVDRDGQGNLIDAAEAEGTDVVLMSVVGAAPDSPMELFRMKYAAEQHLLRRGIPATVVRSTAFLELWIELLTRTAGRSGAPLVFGRGDNPINFVSVVDVATLVEVVISDDTTRGATLQIGGPQNLTFNELASAVALAAGCDRSPRHIPRSALRVMANTVGRIKPDVRRAVCAALAMDESDLTFDPTTSPSDSSVGRKVLQDLLAG